MAIKRGTSTITIVNPISIIADSVELMKERARELFISIGGFSRQERVSMNSFFKAPSLSRFNFNFFNDLNKKKVLRIVAPLVIIVFLILGIYSTFNRQPTIQVVNTSIETTQADKTVSLNREFKFPLRDQKGKEIGKLSYTLKDAELRKQIIVKGKRATVVAGRIFLIINLKIANTLDRGLEVNSRDYIRISVNGKTKELFAPDIHNDPVEVQAISTKNTRVGLAINESDRDIILQVGEINGKKTIIPLSF